MFRPGKGERAGPERGRAPRLDHSEAESLFLGLLDETPSGEAPDVELLCDARPELAARIRELRACFSDAERMVAVLGGEEADATALSRRYRVLRALARGGMGEILEVYDENLGRILAMKVLRRDRASRSQVLEQRRRLRLRNEARILGQLEHPGIVPVHEVGRSEHGEPYFTMRRVQGRDFSEIAALVASAAEGWTQTRAVDVVLRVCEAVAHAHAKGILHRDLKPSNVMVGPFGEVYVMDWGLAKERAGERGLGEAAPDGPVAGDLGSPPAGSDRDSLTADGEVVGTPAYMAPEQAAGRVGATGERVDVYSVGAILYHLLVGHAPYGDERRDARATLEAVLAGEAAPVERAARDAPRELVAITAKAMARDPARRFDSMEELAADLRAYLEGRVVSSHRTGTWIELEKWIARNRGLAGSLLAALVLALVGLGSVLYVQGRSNRALSTKNDELGRAWSEARANEQRAEQRAAEVLQLADRKRLQDLETEAEALWPAEPSLLADMEAWLVQANRLAGRLELHRATLGRMRAAAPRAEGGEARASRARRIAGSTTRSPSSSPPWRTSPGPPAGSWRTSSAGSRSPRRSASVARAAPSSPPSGRRHARPSEIRTDVPGTGGCGSRRSSGSCPSARTRVRASGSSPTCRRASRPRGTRPRASWSCARRAGWS